MKAVMCEAYGPVETLQFKDVDAPVAGEGQVLIDVQAAGCNAPDALLIEGKYQIKLKPPFSPGGEGAGVISAVGGSNTGFAVGDRVLFYSLGGAFAQQIVLPRENVVAIPDAMPFDLAAGFLAAYGTAYNAFKQRARLQPEEHVLVLGAAGGIGLAAVETAKAMGAKVIACASSDAKLEVCKAAGADWLINYSTEELKTAVQEKTGRKNVDIIVDPVGGEFAETAFRLMAPGGRHLVIGFVAGEIPSIPLNLPLLKEASIVGVFWNSFLLRDHAAHLENMDELYQFYLEGKLKPLVCEKFALEDYADAFRCIAERRAKGKVILQL